MAEHHINYSNWIESPAGHENVLHRPAKLLDHQNANPDDNVNAYLEQLPHAPSINTELGDMMPSNPFPVQCLPETNVDWVINQFFDFDKAALEPPTHDPTSAEPLCPCSRALDASAEPLVHSFTTLLKRPRATSEFEVQPDALVAQNMVVTNINGQAAIQSQSYQWGKHSDSNISASHIPITPASRLYPEMLSGGLRAPLSSGAEAVHLGFHCFDWKSQEEKHQDQRLAKKARKEISKQQREETKEVREKGACLRCYLLKLKCSSGYPCNTCKTLFECAHSSRTLQWRACIESSLADINIFTYGCALLSNGNGPRVNPFIGFTLSGPEGFISGHQAPGAKTSLSVVDPSLYNAILQVMDYEGESSLLCFLDCLYLDILRAQGHLDGRRTDTTHTFILEDRNPLHMLLHVNTIIVGSHLLGERLVGYKEYLLHLRAISSSLAFEGLENSLGRTALANSSITRLLALIVYISVLLEQVIEVGEHGAASWYVSSDNTYKTMQDHLIEYLSCYLRKLSTNVFAPGARFLALVKKAPADFIQRSSFWKMLSKVTGLSALKTLPKAHQLSNIGHIPLDEEPSVNSVAEPDLHLSIREERRTYFSQATLETLDLVLTEKHQKQRVRDWLMSM